MTLCRKAPLVSFAVFAVSLSAQMLDPAALLKPPVDTWPTYNGDYWGQRHSTLAQINATNVKSLIMAWTHRVDLGPFSKARQSDEGRQIKATPLLVKDVLYFSITDHVWAADARTGKELWHYEWPDNRAIHVANRGLGMYGDWLYYMSPDNWLVSLNAKTGKERWRKQVADVSKEWFSSFAPLVIKNHVLTAAAINTQLDKGWLESRDPETGELQWKWYTIPNPGEAGSDTWPDAETMSHGQGNPWLNGTYDPELNLYYFGTGDAAPPRRAPHPNANNEDSLYATTLIALNPDTGKKVWHFQVTPHDDKDYDAGQTPILFDAEFQGQRRKLVAQVNRNGYYFLLDRVTGQHLVTAKYMPETNWGKEIDSFGHVVPDHNKDVSNPAGVLYSPYALGATNWWSPSFDPKTGLIFVNAARSWAFTSRSGGGGRFRYPREYVTMALDYRTGKTVWTHELGSGGPGNLISGLLSTAGDVLFGGDSAGNFLAMAPASGKTLWHANVDQMITNAPMTYMMDGRQYVVVAALDTFFAFTLPKGEAPATATMKRNLSMTYRQLTLVTLLVLLPLCVVGQLLDPAAFKKPPTDTWPTYNGDYSGQRYSTLSKITASNVKNLGLAWTHRFDLGGMSTSQQAWEGRRIKATPLLVKGVLYFSITDHIWAADARSGREYWHYEWPDNRAIHVANRGLGMYGDWLYYMTPDNYLLSLNAKTGKERWRKQVADVKQDWFSSFAPMVIGNHVLTAAGNNNEVRSWLESRDPETGELQWKWYTTPEPGEPGSETWTDVESMLHGGGNPWLNGTYDPELNLYYFGTGDGVPRMRAPHPNADGEDSLYTATIVAINPNTGKKVWHFQVTPHDNRDWDAAQTPILFDAEFKGQRRKLLAQVSRNGYFFLLDRATGQSLVTTKYMPETNWGRGIDAKGHVIPDYSKDVGNQQGTLVSPYALGATNSWAPAYDPKTGLIFVNGSRSWNYISRSGRGNVRYPREYVTMAIDYKTGKVVWTHELGDKGTGNLISGLLTTAGGVLFSGDSIGNFLAMDPATGKTLWHTNVDQFITNAPMTYELDGRQYVLVGANDTMFAFTLPQ